MRAFNKIIINIIQFRKIQGKLKNNMKLLQMQHFVRQIGKLPESPPNATKSHIRRRLEVGWGPARLARAETAQWTKNT